MLKETLVSAVAALMLASNVAASVSADTAHYSTSYQQETSQWVCMPVDQVSSEPIVCPEGTTPVQEMATISETTCWGGFGIGYLATVLGFGGVFCRV